MARRHSRSRVFEKWTGISPIASFSPTRVPASSEPRGTLRFGPDGRLYVALDDGGVPGRADDLASANGKILRLTRTERRRPIRTG